MFGLFVVKAFWRLMSWMLQVGQKEVHGACRLFSMSVPLETLCLTLWNYHSAREGKSLLQIPCGMPCFLQALGTEGEPEDENVQFCNNQRHTQSFMWTLLCSGWAPGCLPSSCLTSTLLLLQWALRSTFSFFPFLLALFSARSVADAALCRLCRIGRGSRAEPRAGGAAGPAQVDLNSPWTAPSQAWCDLERLP